MDIRQIDEDFFVSPQITKEDIGTLAQAGFKAIICNRPDFEDNDQPEFSEIKKEAEKYGMPTYFLPVTPPHLDQKTISELDEILKKPAKPILAYCRSGSRSAQLYQIVKAAP